MRKALRSPLIRFSLLSTFSRLEEGFLVVLLPDGESILQHQHTALMASPWGEAPPQAVTRGLVGGNASSTITSGASPPHPSRYSLDTFSPKGEGFHSRAFSSCMADIINYCNQSCMIPRPTMPAGQRTAQLDARAGEARPKGKYSRGRMALAPIRARRIFPATGAHSPALPSTSNPTFFHVTHRFFVSFLTQERNVTPPFPRPPVL